MWLADPARPKALHDAKGPMHALAARGLELAGVTSDTALAAYLALPGQRPSTWPTWPCVTWARSWLRRRGGIRPARPGPHRRAGARTRPSPSATALVWQAAATAELATALDADLDRRGATRLLHDVELPLVDVLARMERAGIAADTDHLAAMSATLGGEVKAAEQGAYALIGHEFNLGSPKQLQEILFTELGLPKTKRIKTGYTTDSEALTGLLARPATRCSSTCCATATSPSSRASWTR